MKAIENFLLSQKAPFWALLLVLAVMIDHNGQVFALIAKSAGYTGLVGQYIGLLSAIAIEFAILMFIVNNEAAAGKIYAVASFLVNLLYYWLWSGSIREIAAMVIYSAMISGSLWYFSELFRKRLEKSIIRCPECDKIFHTAKELNGHMSGVHKRKLKAR